MTDFPRIETPSTTSKSVDRAEIALRIVRGPAPEREAIAMIGTMAAIIEAERGKPAVRQILMALADADVTRVRRAMQSPTDPSPADVVARLREAATSIRGDGTPAQVGMTAEECDAAADLITSQAAEIEMLRGETFLAAAEAAEHHRDNAINMWAKERERATAAGAEAATLRKRVDALEKAARRLSPYLEWQLSDESPGHHPTFPSAVASFLAALVNKETENV